MLFLKGRSVTGMMTYKRTKSCKILKKIVPDYLKYIKRFFPPFFCNFSEAIMYTAASICYSYDSSQDSVTKVSLGDLCNSGHFMPEIETQNRRDWVRITQLICNSFRSSTHPDILTPLLCSYYKVQLLLHISVLPISYCLLGK